MIRRFLLPLAVLLLAGGLALLLGFGGGRGEDGSELAEERPDASDAVLRGSVPRVRPGQPTEGAKQVDLVDPLPADLPAWGIRVQVVEDAREEVPRPLSGITVRALLVGPEGDLHAWAGTTDAQGVSRIGPLGLPPVPRRLLGQLSLELRPVSTGPRAFAWWRWNMTQLASRVRAAEEIDGTRWLAATLDWSWSGPFARGRLLTSSGHPVAGVWVGVKPSSRGVVASPTHEDGAFSVRLPNDGAPVEQIHAEAMGAFEVRHAEAMGERDPDAPLEVRLPGGDEAGGRVVDAAGEPLAGVHLVLAEPWWNPNAGLTLSRGGYTPPHTILRFKTHSAADGRFAFPGLKDGQPYVLWWPGDDGTWRRLSIDVHCGDEDLEVVVTRHRLRPVLVDAVTRERVYGQVRFRRLGGDGELVYPSVRSADAAPNEDGRIAAPGERFRFYAWALGYAVAVAELTMPGEPGTHDARIAMRRLAPGHVTRIRFVDQAGRALGPVPVVLEREVPGFWGDLDLEVPYEEDADGWIRLRDLPPGPVDVETQERLGRPPNGRWRYTLPLEVELEVPEKGRFEREIPCPQGGSVRLVLHRPTGDRPGTIGRLELHHETGAETSPWWYARMDDGSWDYEVIGDGKFEPDGRSYESSALPEGAWTLQIEESKAWHAVSVPLRVAPSEITDVHVTLQPRQ